MTDLDLSSDASYYLAYDLGVEKGDSLSWEHTFLKRNGSSIITYNGRKYLSVVNLEGTLSSYSNLYFDNLAISKANPATSTFGKYNCYSGTSMAAPFVTGSCALLMEWGIVKGNDQYMYGEKLKAYLINGATRVGNVWPDSARGWGELCVAASIPVK